MVDVMDMQFHKLTIKLDVFVDANCTINTLIENLSTIIERQAMVGECK